MDLIKQSIERLKLAAETSLRLYHAPLIVTTCGGKDSSVCVELAQRAGIEFEIQHSYTTADAQETVRFVRQEFRRLEEKGVKCTITYPTYKGGRVTMWSLILAKLMPPTRKVRYCCDVLKEYSGKNRCITTGVRWAESTKRANRGIYEAGSVKLNNDNDGRSFQETCKMKGKRIFNPIVDWTDDDVWDFIRSEKVPVNPLYECGFSRVGCIGCPMAGKHCREREFAKWPGYKRLYIKAFQKMLEERARRGKLEGGMRWGETAEDVFHWWMEDGVLPGQETLEGFGEMEDEE